MPKAWANRVSSVGVSDWPITPRTPEMLILRVGIPRMKVSDSTAAKLSVRKVGLPPFNSNQNEMESNLGNSTKSGGKPLPARASHVLLPKTNFKQSVYSLFNRRVPVEQLCAVALPRLIQSRESSILIEARTWIQPVVTLP